MERAGRDRVCQISSVLVVLCVLLLGSLWVFESTAVRHQSTVSRTLDVRRYGLQYLHGQRMLRDILYWPALVKSAHTQAWNVPLEKHSTELQYLRDCWKDPSWYRMVCWPVLGSLRSNQGTSMQTLIVWFSGYAHWSTLQSPT